MKFLWYKGLPKKIENFFIFFLYLQLLNTWMEIKKKKKTKTFYIKWDNKNYKKMLLTKKK